jgi:hypothetical protein
MMRYGKTVCDSDFRRGQRELQEHRPDLAVRSLRKAAEACPASRPGELSERLYWLALALFRLDRPELALKGLASAQKLRPRGIARAAYAHRVNEYGMLRRQSPELDDFYAFYSIHSCAYLGRKRNARFDSSSEKDNVVRLIGDSWRTVSRSGRLAGLGPAEKLALFREWPIAFPSFGVLSVGAAREIPVNFKRGARQDCDERCSCGSGLPYRQCCGRTASPSERFCE